MNEVVNELATLVGGSGAANQKRAYRRPRRLNIKGDQAAAKKAHEPVSKHHELTNSDHVFHNVAEGKKQQAKKPKATVGSAARAIPLDENFEEFNS
jgi:hypothetical protein